VAVRIGGIQPDQVYEILARIVTQRPVFLRYPEHRENARQSTNPVHH